MLEKDLQRQNRIPGCDRMTRPEEISALGKYLKNIRETQEAHTKLNDTILGVNPSIPEIESLDDRVLKLNIDPSTSPSELVHESELLPENKGGEIGESLESEIKEKIPEDNKEDIESLSDYLLSIPDPDNLDSLEISSLSTKREDLEEDKIKEPESLSTSINQLPEISRLQNPELETERVKIEGDTTEKVDGLAKEVQEANIIPGKIIEPSTLSKEVKEIEGIKDKVTELEDEVKSIPEIESQDKTPDKLPSDIEENIPGKISSIYKLSDSTEKISGEEKEIKKLGEEIKKVEGDKINITSLSDTKEKISGENVEIKNLSKEIKEIEGSKIDFKALSDKREKISGEIEKNPQLSSEVIQREGSDKDIKFLSSKTEKIENASDKVISLSDEVKDIENFEDKVKSLSSFTDNIKNSDENKPKELSEYREKISGENIEIKKLEDQKEKLKNIEDKVEDLSSQVEKISGENIEISKLSDQRKNIENAEDKVENLSSQVENIEGDKKEAKSLSDYVDPIEGEGVSDKVNSLSDVKKKLEPKDNRENKLSEFVDNINNYEDKVENLSNYVDDLEPGAEDVTGLSDYVDNIDNYEDKIENLSNYVDDLEPKASEIDNLSDYTDELEKKPEDVKGLSDIKKEREDSSNEDWFNPEAEGNALYDTVLQRNPSTNPKSDNPELSDFIDQRNPSTNPKSDNPELSNIVEKRGESTNPKSDNPELSNIVEERGDSDANKTGEVYEELEDASDPEWLKQYAKNTDRFKQLLIQPVPEREKFNSLIDLINEVQREDPNDTHDWTEKFKAYITSTMLNTTEDGAVMLLKDQGSNLPIFIGGGIDDKYRIPKYKAGNVLANALDGGLTGPIRQAAEAAVDLIPGAKGKLRQLLLDEAIGVLIVAREKLEHVAKAEKFRLPGDGNGILQDILTSGMDGALQTAGKKIGNSIVGAVGGYGHPNPVNRPEDEKHQETIGWEAVNNRDTVTHPNGGGKGGSGFVNNLKKIGNSIANSLIGQTFGSKINYQFAANYVNSSGIQVTLNELCEGVGIGDIKTVENLHSVLRQSPYITTPDKFTTTRGGGPKVFTLDSNCYWEIILEPYLNTDNGNISFLPSFGEINRRNIQLHGVNTGYNKWIPCIGFDLQKSKMTSKSLALFDGEINYPISIEYTNEFRMTLVDDQFKSWKNFFETVAEVSVYSSVPHTPTYYGYTNEVEEIYKSAIDNLYKDLGLDNKFATKNHSINTDFATAIDTKNIIPANYKNITWRCRIYILTPQFSTIRKYDLLLVMKDFIEEYEGEIDGGGSDLTVSFCIVGENPNTGKIYKPKANKPDPKVKYETPNYSCGMDLGSILNRGALNVMSVL